MRHRFYDPALGRFLTEDPARAGDNWYGYANNNPISNWDPSGLWIVDFATNTAIKEPGDTIADLWEKLGRPTASEDQFQGQFVTDNAFVRGRLAAAGSLVDESGNEVIGDPFDSDPGDRFMLRVEWLKDIRPAQGFVIGAAGVGSDPQRVDVLSILNREAPALFQSLMFVETNGTPRQRITDRFLFQDDILKMAVLERAEFRRRIGFDEGDFMAALERRTFGSQGGITETLRGMGEALIFVGFLAVDATAFGPSGEGVAAFAGFRALMARLGAGGSRRLTIQQGLRIARQRFRTTGRFLSRDQINNLRRLGGFSIDRLKAFPGKITGLTTAIRERTAFALSRLELEVNNAAVAFLSRADLQVTIGLFMGAATSVAPGGSLVAPGQNIGLLPFDFGRELGEVGSAIADELFGR